MEMRNSNTAHSASNLVRFYRPETELYKKLVRTLHQDQETMRWVMALWLWFESIGFYGIIQRISSSTDNIILSFIEEAVACLKKIKEGNNGNRDDELPNTTALVEEPINLRFFDCHHDVAITGIHKFFKNVANIIFGDENLDVVAENGNHPSRGSVMLNILNTKSFGEGTSQEGLPIVEEMADTMPAIVMQSSLNPIAEPWSPTANRSPQELRSMFITFSRGYPIAKGEIIEFFTSLYGDCIEKVIIENAPPGSTPMFGRMVFNSTSMIALVLNGRQTAKFVINGKHLWARMFTPHNSSSSTRG